MNFNSINIITLIDIFLLLLIGIGPKIALVPFLELTAKMDKRTKGLVIKKMLFTSAFSALVLIFFGGFLTRLLHFSPEALSIAGGIILFIISASMILNQGDSETQNKSKFTKDPMKLAVFPLAVPYILNPAGIVALVTFSAEASSIGFVAIVIVILAFVLCIDVLVFQWAKKVSEHLDESRMLITEKVFGFLLAALGVQLVLDGLSDLGIIHLISH